MYKIEGGVPATVLAIGDCGQIPINTTLRIHIVIQGTLTPRSSGGLYEFPRVRVECDQMSGQTEAFWLHDVGIWVCYRQPCRLIIETPNTVGDGFADVQTRYEYLQRRPIPLTVYTASGVVPVPISPPPGGTTYICNQVTTLRAGAIAVPANMLTTIAPQDHVIAPADSVVTFFTPG